MSSKVQIIVVSMSVMTTYASTTFAWDTHVANTQGQRETWDGVWDSEHRQIAYEVLTKIGARAYADFVNPVPSTGSYQERMKGSRRGPCTHRLKRGNEGLDFSEALPGLVGRTHESGFCVRDLNLWIRRNTLDRGKSPTLRSVAERFLAEHADLGDDPSTALEERFVPDPDHFVELPDASYTLYDWILKNSVTTPDPSIVNNYTSTSAGLNPLGASGGHMFAFWMGATNASHFGNSAYAHWQRNHRIALGLAKQASALRVKLRASFSAHPEWRDVVEEAEREALAYEGMAQHYLTDRWSSGHMWNRWGSADRAEIQRVGFASSYVATLITGLLHGSQGVLGTPMPMSSPAILTNATFSDEEAKAEDPCFPMGVLGLMTDPRVGACVDGMLSLWGQRTLWGAPMRPFRDMFGNFTGTRITGVLPAKALLGIGSGPSEFVSVVGDHRYPDLLADTWKPNDADRGDGTRNFPGGEVEYPLHATKQLETMQMCSGKSFAEVFRALGPGQHRGFGLLEVALDSKYIGSIDSPSADYATCWQTWVRNEEFRTAAKLLGLYSLNEAARASIVLTVLGSLPQIVLGAGSMYEGIDSTQVRTELVGLIARIRLEALSNPNDSTLARGGMGPFMGVNIDTRLAQYVEPASLDALPSRAENEPAPVFSQDPYYGRDKASIYGFFNRAHAKYWCERSNLMSSPSDDEGREDLRLISSELDYEGDKPAINADNRVFFGRLRRPAHRAPKDEHERKLFDMNVEVCEMLATRKWRGSYTWVDTNKYAGDIPVICKRSDRSGFTCLQRYQYLQHPHEKYDSLCNTLGVFDTLRQNAKLPSFFEPKLTKIDWSRMGNEWSEKEELQATREYTIGLPPYFIDRGYAPMYPDSVTKTASPEDVQKHGLDPHTGYPKTVMSWCEKIPVIAAVKKPYRYGDLEYYKQLVPDRYHTRETPNALTLAKATVGEWNRMDIHTQWYAGARCFPGTYYDAKNNAFQTLGFPVSGPCATAHYYTGLFLGWTGREQETTFFSWVRWQFGHWLRTNPSEFRADELYEPPEPSDLYDNGLIGSKMFLAGANFGIAGRVEFTSIDSKEVTTVVKSTDSEAEWKSETGSWIGFKTPTLTPGEYFVRVINTTDPERPRASQVPTRVSIACPWTRPQYLQHKAYESLYDIVLPTTRAQFNGSQCVLECTPTPYHTSYSDPAGSFTLSKTESCTTYKDCVAKGLKSEDGSKREFWTRCTYKNQEGRSISISSSYPSY